MTVDELIENYQIAIGELWIAEGDGNEVGADDAVNQATDAAAALKGKTVVARVTWHNGRTTETTGTIISLDREKVYLQSSLGAVEGDAMGMSAA